MLNLDLNNIIRFDLNNLPSLQTIRDFRSTNKIIIEGNKKWEDIRMDSQYHEYWKIVHYYIENNSRIIVIQAYISMSSDPKQVGSILWSDVTNIKKYLLAKN